MTFQVNRGGFETVLELYRQRVRRKAIDVPEELTAVLRFLAEHLFESELRIKDIGKRFDISRGRLDDRFKRELGSPPGTFVRTCRMEAARLLLRSQELAVWEVAERVGYTSSRAFSVAYSRWAGHGPEVEKSRAASEALDATRRPVRHELEEHLFEVLGPVIGKWSRGERWRLAVDGFVLDWEIMFRELLRASRVDCRQDRRFGVSIAELAVDVLRGQQGSLSVEMYAAHQVEALANLGNTRRLAGDDDGADREFQRVDIVLQEHTVAPRIEATYLAYKAYLRTFQRRSAEVPAILDRAYGLTVELGADVALARLLLNRGLGLELQNRLSAALDDYREALRLISSCGEPDSYLLLVAYQHVAVGHGLLLEHDEARRYLGLAREVAQAFTAREVHHRLDWLEGLLLASEGDFEAAERQLAGAYRSVVASGETINAAILALDVAGLALRTGRNDDARHFALEALPVLTSARMDDETLLALRVFEEALEQDRATCEQLRPIRELLVPRFRVPRWFRPTLL